MIVVRDFYLAAFAIEKGINYTCKKGRLSLDVDSITLKSIKKEFRAQFSSLTTRVKELSKELDHSKYSSSSG